MRGGGGREAGVGRGPRGDSSAVEAGAPVCLGHPSWVGRDLGRVVKKLY